MVQLITMRDDFELLDDWEDRYRYIIELGHQLERLDETDRNAASKVHGCVSQVWLVHELRGRGDEPTLHFRGDSDSHLVRGLLALAIAIFSDKSPREIMAIDAGKIFREFGLEQHLTPQRSNGVRAMVERIRATAASVLV